MLVLNMPLTSRKSLRLYKKIFYIKFNYSTIQLFNYSTIQLFNYSTIQRFNQPKLFLSKASISPAIVPCEGRSA